MLSRDPTVAHSKRLDGLYPLHMAFRTSISHPSEDLVRLLLKHNPQAVHTPMKQLSDHHIQLRPLQIAIKDSYPEPIIRLLLNIDPLQNIVLSRQLNWQARRYAIMTSFPYGCNTICSIQTNESFTKDIGADKAIRLSSGKDCGTHQKTMLMSGTAKDIKTFNVFYALRVYNYDCWKMTIEFL